MNISAIIGSLKRAVLADAATSTGNRITLELIDDRTKVRVWSVLAGKPHTWIDYDTQQLDELIRLFEMIRKDMR
jgi:hypothetical protein